MWRDASKIRRGCIPTSAAASVGARRGCMPIVARPAARAFAAVGAALHRGSVGLGEAGRGFRMSGARPFARDGELVALKLDLAHNVRGVEVRIFPTFLNKDPASENDRLFGRELDGAPNFTSSVVIERGVEPQGGTTQDTGRGR